MRLSAGLTITVNDRVRRSVDLVSNASAHATSGKQRNLLILKYFPSRSNLPSYPSLLPQVFACDHALSRT